MTTKHCATCPATTTNTLADGWLIIDGTGKHSAWKYECANCTDKRIGVTETIATYTVPAAVLPEDFK